MATVVVMSLQGSVVQVPEIVGKNLSDSKNELASLGLEDPGPGISANHRRS